MNKNLKKAAIFISILSMLALFSGCGNTVNNDEVAMEQAHVAVEDFIPTGAIVDQSVDGATGVLVTGSSAMSIDELKSFFDSKVSAADSNVLLDWVEADVTGAVGTAFKLDGKLWSFQLIPVDSMINFQIQRQK